MQQYRWAGKSFNPIKEDLAVAAAVASIGDISAGKAATIAGMAKSAAAAAGVAVDAPVLRIGGVVLPAVPFIQCSYRTAWNVAEAPEARSTRREKRKMELQ